MIKHVVVWKIKDQTQKAAHAKAVKRALGALGVPAAQSRYEFFGPAAALE